MANLTKYAEKIKEFVMYSNRDVAQQKAFVEWISIQPNFGYWRWCFGWASLHLVQLVLLLLPQVKEPLSIYLNTLEEAQLQRILVDAAKDPKLLEALLRNPATYARGGKSRTSTYLARYLTSRGIGNIVDVTDDRKMRDARQANQAGQTSKVAELILQFANPYGEVRQRMRQIDPMLKNQVKGLHPRRDEGQP
jgi:hypothetical protein